VPILTVDAQAATTETALALASASFATLRNYVHSLEADGAPVRHGVTVRELGAPEGGTLGGSNNLILMVLAFFLVFGLGCAAILLVPSFAQRWRALDDVEYADANRAHADATAHLHHDNPPHSYDPTPLASGEPREHIAPHAAPSR
jgi:hypothetical protein